MRKRYMITMDEADHRRLSAAAKLAGVPLGQYLGGFMDDRVRKAVEPEQIKVQSDGKLSKGLGTLPGQEPPTRLNRILSMPTPAPKPGVKK